MKLTGEVRLCENAGQVVNGVSCQAPGQIVTTFKNTPDCPSKNSNCTSLEANAHR